MQEKKKQTERDLGKDFKITIHIHFKKNKNRWKDGNF